LADELEKVIHSLNAQDKDFILIGEGSNLLVSDQGIPCPVVRFFSPEPLIEVQGLELTVFGSTLLDDVVLFAANKGLKGLNYASGIPGTVGGAVAGNAGAFGQQVGDHIRSVSLITLSGEKKEASPDELRFSYRNSVLKTSRDIVSSVTFTLEHGETSALLNEREEILSLRKQKHPDYKVQPCAGSIFRNIESTSQAEKRQAAGWFLEAAGAKALYRGGAYVFERHANIIVKSEGATAQDVYDLIQDMEGSVRMKFGIKLIREVRLLGRFAGMPEDVKRVIW
jgi:UDP-N-acetylmuramate dehydrogenase